MSEARQDKQMEALVGEDAQVGVASLGDIRSWQGRLVEGMLRAIAIIGLLVAAAGTYDSFANQEFWTIPFYWGAYVVIVVLTLWRRAPYSLRVWGIMVLVYTLGFTDFVQDGRSGSARIFMLIVPFLAGLFLGFRESVVALLLGSLTMAGFGWAFSTGLLVAPGDQSSADLTGWIAGTLTFFMMGTLMVVSLNYLVPRLSLALEQSRELTRALGKQRDRLEEQVAARTEDLMRRRSQLEAAAQVARDATAIQDVDQLLEETARLVSVRLGFYHTGIFLLDEQKEYAVLRAASSAGGQRMLARGHRLRVGEVGAGVPPGEAVGIVGYVTYYGEPRIALDVGADAVHFDNPDLPETRSEVALPLRARGEVIGALDVQSTEPGAFSQEDVAVLQTLADQVAVALSNARLFRQAQESLVAERRAYGEISRQAWEEMVRRRIERGFLCDEEGIVPLGLDPSTADLRLTMEQAAQAGQVIVGDSLSVPIPVRDQVVGALNFRKAEVGEPWTDEEVTLLQNMADQLGQALESARLYQDTQRRAAREQLIGEVTARMRETLDIDAVLRTAVREIGESLALHDITVRLEAEDDGVG
ncbi:MAG: GAF domain-containing protein [Anaerolineae bacterium]|jgi:GAF domain-containing protein